MIIALYIFLAIVVVGFLLYIEHRHHTPTADTPAAEETTPTPKVEDEECCGMHVTCERDSLLASVSPEIEYYDDEELDSYSGVNPQDYSDEAVEQFRDVLLTLLPDDIAGWARSLQLRGIQLPTPVREELLMIVAEARKTKSESH